ncbi:MAG: polysaccharide deacetylase family protein, partial [Clostridiales bacterium]|nr:polysaccharide deacetylase family protein [Clostridiales bacterium]
GWAKNGESAGTSGLSLRLEAIQVVMMAKGAGAPGAVAGITSVRSESTFSDADFDKIVSEGLFSGWITAGGSTYYILKNADGSGSLANGVVNVDGTDFVFENGKLAPNQRVLSGNKLYYTDGNGNIYRIVDGDKPMVALTFDDGPTQYTSQILDTLEANGGKATFFVMGCLVASGAPQIQRAYNMGCQIGSHTWDHPTLTKCSADKILQELNSTDAAVQAVIGCPTSIMRPPGGATNGTVGSIIAQTGKPQILWSIDTRDWENHNAQMIINNVLSNVKDGSIVLMHDRLSCTAVACQTIIPTLTAQGYQLVTVEEMALLNGGMTPGAQYRSF